MRVTKCIYNSIVMANLLLPFASGGMPLPTEPVPQVLDHGLCCDEGSRIF